MAQSESTQVNGEGLKYLKGLPQLQGLSLKNTKVIDVRLEHLMIPLTSNT